jgi:hypothetical protein
MDDGLATILHQCLLYRGRVADIYLHENYGLAGNDLDATYNFSRTVDQAVQKDHSLSCLKERYGGVTADETRSAGQ